MVGHPVRNLSFIYSIFQLDDSLTGNLTSFFIEGSLNADTLPNSESRVLRIENFRVGRVYRAGFGVHIKVDIPKF